MIELKKNLSSFLLLLVFCTCLINCNGGNSSSALQANANSSTTPTGTIIYVTNFSFVQSNIVPPAVESRANTISKCALNTDNSLTCTDSGVGSVFREPFDIALSSDGTQAYISNSTESYSYGNLGTVSQGSINPDGSFGSCADAGSSNNYSAPYGIAINPATGIAYINDFNISSVTTCIMEGNDFHYCYIDPFPLLSQPAGIVISDFNNTTYTYIVNYANHTVTKCAIGNDTSLSGCVDSGAGAIFPAPFGIAINPNLLIAYITGHGNATIPSSVYGCKVNPADGSFNSCVMVLDPTTLNSVGGNNPSLITFNTADNSIFFTGSSSNDLVRCTIEDSDYTKLTCAPVVINSGSVNFNFPTGIRIKY